MNTTVTFTRFIKIPVEITYTRISEEPMRKEYPGGCSRRINVEKVEVTIPHQLIPIQITPKEPIIRKWCWEDWRTQNG